MRGCVIALLWLASVALAFIAGKDKAHAPEYITLTKTDTLIIRQPEVMVIKAKESKTERLAIANADSIADSCEVTVPYTQKIYSAAEYTAFISGHNPNLDSIRITRNNVCVSQCLPRKTRRWSIGIQAGYGATPAGLQPYIGLGVSFSIL